MKKKRKTKAIDRISKLPDDLISKIIHLLPLKQAVSTCVLSTRWKDTWKKKNSVDFDFDGSSVFNELRNIPGRGPPSKRVGDSVYKKWECFLHMVDAVLHSHHKGGATIQRLRIVFDPMKLSHTVIDNWLQLAFAKKVQFVEFNFKSIFVGTEPSSAYVFPVITSRCALESLKTLVLKEVEICGEAIEALLHHCVNIQELSVTSADTLRAVKVSSFSLKRLTLLACGGYRNLMDIKISAPNLLSFTWSCCKNSKLLLEDVPKLNYVKISGYWYHIRSHHSQLQQLVLNVTSFGSSGCVNKGNTNIPELSNLKQLTMKQHRIDDDAFGLFVAYLAAAPLLENVTLQLFSGGWNVKLSEAVLKATKNHCFENLKTVKFSGFSVANESNDAEFVEYIVNRAPLLETIIVDVIPLLFVGTHERNEYKQTAEYLEARDKAINFGASLPCHVTVV
ncbi:hypothetical protein ACFE04_004137 [Oxalis oulophora]